MLYWTTLFVYKVSNDIAADMPVIHYYILLYIMNSIQICIMIIIVVFVLTKT